MDKPFLIALSLLVASCASQVQKAPSPAGLYRTVTESEWGMDVLLSPDGNALVEIASWMPGESEDATIEKHKGTWSVSANTVTLNLAGGEVLFTYLPSLPFTSFGKEGAAPGLQGMKATFEARLFEGRELWLAKALDRINWEATD